jgi:CRISPR/Cas system CMR-associated protein Cmr5 small subunit
MNELENIIYQLKNTPTDINEHIETLVKYASQCDHVTEMGVRGIFSTWAFVASKPKKIISYDLYNPSKYGGNINNVYTLAKKYNIEFEFHEANVRDIKIENTDLLFIDTWHVYEQLKIELKLHAPKTNKYIIMHDTTLFGEKGEGKNNKGLWLAIEEFLVENPQWQILEKFTHNNGLTVLKKD